MKGKGMIIIFTAFFVALVFGLLYEMCATNPGVEENIEIHEENTQLYAALVAVGIEDAIVDITDERALIRFNLPNNLNKEATWYYIMSASAAIAPETDKIIIQTYENYERREEVTVNTTDVMALINGNITMEEFQKMLKVSNSKN